MSDPINFFCNICNRNFTTKKRYENHMQSYHGVQLNLSNMFKCEHCNHISSTKGNLKIHSSTCKAKNKIDKTDKTDKTEEPINIEKLFFEQQNEYQKKYEEKLKKYEETIREKDEIIREIIREKDEIIREKDRLLVEQNNKYEEMVKQFIQSLDYKVSSSNTTHNNNQKTIIIQASDKVLEPVTTEFIKTCLKSAMEYNKFFFQNEDHLAQDVMAFGLKDRMIVTDLSRNTSEWIDGDNNNMKVKDFQTKCLAKKTIEATLDIHEELHKKHVSNKELYYKDFEEDDDLAPLPKVLEINNGTNFLIELNTIKQSYNSSDKQLTKKLDHTINSICRRLPKYNMDIGKIVQKDI